MNKKLLFLTFIGLFMSVSVYAQMVTGKVTSASNGEALPGVSVLLKGTSTGTVTNADGVYAINVPNTQTAVLIFSSVGYTSQEINVEGRATIDLGMQDDIQVLNDIVVTALGIEKDRTALSSAVSEVKGTDLIEARTNNVMSNLVGRVAGVNIVSTATGAAGSTRVVIRGNSSLSAANQPLYVVDGIPIDNTNRGSAGEWGGRDAGDGVQSINPDEIESITVLKGGNAAALYGSRASAGVIMITTKKGNKRKGMGIELNSNFVAETPTNLAEWQDQYGHGVGGVVPASGDVAKGIQLNSWGGKLDGSSVFQFDGVQRPYVAHKDNLKNFYRTGTNFNNTISVFGGSDKMTYRFSVSDLNNQSFIPNSSMRRNNIALNAGFSPSNKLKINLSTRYIRERVKNRPRLSDSPGNANFTVHILPLSIDVNTLKESMTNPDGTERQFNANPYVTNPYWATEMFNQHDERDRVIGVLETRYQLTDWLYLRGKLGTDFYNRTNFEVTPYGTQYTTGGQINDQTSNRFSEFNGEWLVGVQKKFGQFFVDAFVGGNAMINKDQGVSIWGDNFFGPNFYDISNIQSRNSRRDYREKRINSLFFSADISFNKYLYVNLTGRNDWFSTLPIGNNSIFYPSAGISFILSEAVKLPEIFNFAKIFTSYAEVGGDRDPYGLRLPYGYNVPFGSLPLASIATGTIPNPNLKPYNVSTFEMGFETRLLNDLLGIEFTFYNRTTRNDIISSQISGTSGFGSRLLNIGELQNKGIELLLNGTPFKSKNLTWNVGLNTSYNQNKVIKISDGVTSLRAANARSLRAFVDHIEGQPFGQVMGFEYRRDEQGRLILNGGLPQAGDLKAFGTGVAPWTVGLTNDFRYKNFGLNILIDGKFGGVMYSGTNDFGTYRGAHEQTLRGRVEGIVETGVNSNGTPNTTSVTSQAYFQSVGLNISEAFIYKSDFIKLRQIIFSYNLPSNILTKTPFSAITVSLVARNLAILKKYVPNIDPESTYNSGPGQGLEWFGAPPVRSYGVNLNVKF
jgi:TonB-linked SusC/RagA family outer membrane protein